MYYLSSSGYEIPGPFIDESTQQLAIVALPMYKNTSSRGLYTRATSAGFNVFLDLLTYGHGLLMPSEKNLLPSAISITVQELSLIETAVSFWPLR